MAISPSGSDPSVSPIGGDSGGESYPTDPAAYDDDLSAFGGPGDPRYSVGGPETFLVEPPSGFFTSLPIIGDIINIGTAVALAVQRAFGLPEFKGSFSNREIFQTIYGNLPGYKKTEDELFTDVGIRVLTAGVDPASRAGIQLGERVFHEALTEARAGTPMEHISYVVSNSNIEATSEGDVPIGSPFHFEPHDMPNLFPEPEQPEDPFGQSPALPGTPGGPELGGGEGRSSIRGSAGGDRLDGLSPGTVFQGEGGREYVVLPTGAAVPVSAIQGLASLVQRGGTPSPNQLAVINQMTPAQQRAAGIFFKPDGTLASFNDVLLKAVQNAATGQPLTVNQTVALGLVFNATPGSGKRRDLITEIAGGNPVVRANLSAAVGPAMRAATDVGRKAKKQTQAAAPVPASPHSVRDEIIAKVGANTVFVTLAGKQVSGQKVVANALRNLEQGVPLTANQQAVLSQYKAAVPPVERPSEVRGVLRKASAVPAVAIAPLPVMTAQQGRQILAQRATPPRPASPAARTLQAPTRAQAVQVRQQLDARAQVASRAQQQAVARVTAPAPLSQAAQRAQQQAATTRAAQQRAQQQVTAQRVAQQAAATRAAAERAAAARQSAQRAAEQAQLRAAEARRQAAAATQQRVQEQAVVRRAADQATAQRAAQQRAQQQAVARQRALTVYQTTTGQTRTTQQVLANAAKNCKAGKPLTANQKAALKVVGKR